MMWPIVNAPGKRSVTKRPVGEIAGPAIEKLLQGGLGLFAPVPFPSPPPEVNSETGRVGLSLVFDLVTPLPGLMLAWVRNSRRTLTPAPG